MTLSGPGLSGPALYFGEFDASIPNPTAGLLAADPGASRSYLFLARPWDEDAAARVLILLSGDGYASGPGDTLPDGTPLEHYLARGRLVRGAVFNFSSEVMTFSGSAVTTNPLGYFQSASVPSYGVTGAALADDDPEMIAHTRLRWRDAALEMYLGAPDWPLSNFARIARGVAAGLSHDAMTYSVTWGSLAQRLGRDVQQRTFRGQGGALRFTPSTPCYVSGTMPCPAGSLTLGCWMRPANSAATLKRVVGWRDSSGTGAGLRMLDMGLGGANLPRFAVRNDAGTAFTAQAALPVPVGADLLQGTQLTGVLDVIAMEARLLVNGETAATVSVTGAFTTVLSTMNWGRNETGGELFDGDIGEVWAFGAALDDATVAKYIGGPISPTTLGLVGYWKTSDRAPGNVTVFDSTTATPHNLTLSGAVWIGSCTGGPSIAGKKIPRTWGRTLKVEPVNVDPVNGVWLWNDGSVQQLDGIEHGGLQVYVNDGDVADLNLSAPAAGHFTTCNARGMFKLNATVSKHLAVFGKGDNGGALGYREDCAGLVYKIATEDGGLGLDEIDLVAIAVTSAAYPYPVGIDTRLDAVSVDSLCQRLMSYIMGWRVPTREGRLSVGVLAQPTMPKFTLGIDDIARDGCQKVVTTDAVKQTALGYQRYALTQQPSDLAVTTLEQVADLGQEFRATPPTPVDPAVVAGNPSALIWAPNTGLALLADALTERDRQGEYWGAPKDVYAVRLTNGLHQYAIGDPVELTLPIEGLANGWLGVVVQYTENVPMEENLTLIGMPYPNPGFGLLTDTGEDIVIS